VSSKKNKDNSTASLHEQLGQAASDEATEMLDAPSSHEALQTELNKAEERANQYWDRILRMQAEADNVQRRAERDIANAHKYALEKFISELLPVIDSLERAITAHADEAGAPGSLLDGVNMTLKMFLAAVAKFGVEPLDPIGQPFDPAFHQAVSTIESSDVKPGTVLTVLQKGYCLNKRLVRPALVVVAK